MGIQTKVENTFTCDRAECGTKIVYNGKPNPAEKLPTKLADVVCVISPESGYERWYCGTACAILDMNEGKHKPPVANLVVPASAQDVVTAAHNAREAAKLKQSVIRA